MAKVQNPNRPMMGWEASWVDGAGFATGPSITWTGLTDLVLSWQHGHGKQTELGLAPAGTGTVIVLDPNEYLNPLNGSSPWNSGGNLLKSYRQIRHWEMWPLTGNMLNSTNEVWPNIDGSVGLGDASSFEGGTIGSWETFTAVAPALTNSVVRAHDGTHSMLVTWPLHTGAGSVSDNNATTFAVPLRTGVTYTLSMWIWIVSGPAVTIYCNGFSTNSTSTTGAWQRVSLTFVAQDGIADSSSLYIWPAGSTTAGQQIFVDSVQLEVGASATTYTTTGPTINPLFWGYIERYPHTWRFAGFQGLASLTIVDALSVTSTATLLDASFMEIQRDNPTWYWPLREGPGVNFNTGIINYGSAPDRAAPIWQYGTVNGTGVENIQPIVAANGTTPDVDLNTFSNYDFNPVSATDFAFLRNDWAGYNGFSYLLGGAAGPYSIEFFFYANNTGTKQRVCSLTGNANGESTFEIQADGTPRYVYLSSLGVVVNTITGTIPVNDGIWRSGAWTSSSNGVTITESLYVDGVLVGTTTRAGAQVEERWSLYLGGSVLYSTDAYFGNLAHVSLYRGQALTQARLQSHKLTIRSAASNQADTPGQRLGRILAWAGWTANTVLPSGTGDVSVPSGLSGKTVAAAIDETVKTDGGFFYAAPDGRLTFIPRNAYYSQTTGVVTFGDNPGLGDIPYVDGSLETDVDPTYIYNKITVNNRAEYQSTIFRSSAVSINDYGDRTFSISTIAFNYSRPTTLAGDLLIRLQDGHPRVNTITFNLAANPSIYNVIMARRIGDRVSVRRRAPAVTYLFDAFIESIKFSGDEKSMTCTMSLEPIIPYQAGIIGTSLIGTTAIAAY